jgi:hypothetical protein
MGFEGGRKAGRGSAFRLSHLLLPRPRTPAQVRGSAVLDRKTRYTDQRKRAPISVHPVQRLVEHRPWAFPAHTPMK